MKLVNLTPHSIHLRSPDGQEHVIPPSGNVARVTSEQGPRIDSLREYGGVPIYGAAVFGDVEGLPSSTPDTVYIVSMLVASRVPDRADVVCPGTGPNDGAVRASGRVVAVTRLVSAAVARVDHCPYCGGDNGVQNLQGYGSRRENVWDCFHCGGN